MLRAGTVGLPNVGKSTLFNAIVANAQAQAANFPFCTIEPNVGIVSVPDSRLEELAKISSSEAIIPARLEIVDIAGLVEGASKGEGLGNQFLANIREVDAIIHVVRCFENDDITHVAGSVDPARDIEVIELELVYADLAQAERRYERALKDAKIKKEAKLEAETLGKVIAKLNEGVSVNQMGLDQEELDSIAHLNFLTAKPVIFAANVAEDELDGSSPRVQIVRDLANKRKAEVVIISAQVESELMELPEEDRKEFLASLGVTESGLAQLIRTTFHLLGLQTYFTTGPKETRAWTIHQGMSAPQAAGVIHTDFEKGFIRAETVSYEELLSAGSMAVAKERGKVRSEGKEYIVQEGDVMLFRFNV